MQSFIRRSVSFIVLFVCLINIFPNAEACGPYYLTPVFDYQYAPENPFDEFAAGKIGIVKPSYHRVVLFAAYRYLNGGSFSADEQKALVDVWNADFNNKDYEDNDVGKAVKLWVEKRSDVIGKEEKPLAIYTEREYGGYDFFPNCTKNAFETAAQTLSDRAASYGADSRDVKNWVAAQDAVFTNCSSSKQMPASIDSTAPEWLQKDRAYQRAAAEFYALDYEQAKLDFAAIAADTDSPWRETADYLVARTLVRQASLTADEAKRNRFYAEAETQLQKLSNGGNKFADSSEKFMNLIKYRLRPQERVGELAQTLAYGSGNNNFRQDLIDYYWLLDKFETETLEVEQKRKEDTEIAKFAESDKALLTKVTANLAAVGISADVKVSKSVVTLSGNISKGKIAEAFRIATELSEGKVINNLVEVTHNSDGSVTYEGNGNVNAYTSFTSKQIKDDWEAVDRGELLGINLFGDFERRIVINPNATEEEIFEAFQYGQANLTEVEKDDIRKFDEIAKANGEKSILFHPLTDADKTKIRAATQEAKTLLVQNKFSKVRQQEYQGGYYGDEKLSPSLLPDFLRRDDLTEWLFIYQMKDAEAYLYALDKFKQTSSDLWLMTAISKAETSSANVKELLEAASRLSRSSLAYPTVAFHEARLLIALNKQVEAVKVLDEVLAQSDVLPVSSRNQFLELRAGLAQTMDDFFRDSLKKPFAFDLEGVYQTIDELIAEEKSYYNAESTKQSREEYEREIEDRYKNEKRLQNERMFDDQAIQIINEHFPLTSLLEAEKSKILPDYLKERIALTVWVRAVLLNDEPMASRAILEIIRLNSENEAKFAAYLKAKTPAARQNAALYLILKNENLSPYVAGGFGSATDSYNSYASRWWCVPYEDNSGEENGEQIAAKLTAKPKFLTAAQSLAAQTELKQIKKVGNAPEYLGRQVLEWAKRSPLDKRVPESLSIVYEANGWDKYGCGNNEELRNRIGDVLKKKYPDSSWTKQIGQDEQ